MKGDRCPYREKLPCQEDSECINCEVYYLTMSIPHDGRTVEEIEEANSRLFDAESLTKASRGCKVV